MREKSSGLNLTAEQAEVVELAGGRHLVLAPPGSGKTEMLSQRILRALASGVDPERMLCATFTNRAAFEMRERIVSAAGDRELPDVGNLHHFCHRFLLSVGRIHPGLHVLDEVEQLDFVKEVVGVLREELASGADADLKRTHGVAVMGIIEGICEPMRVKLHELLESTFAAYSAKGGNPVPDILSAALILHQQRIGIPPCYLRQLPPGLLALVGAGVISAIERSYSGLKRKFRAVDFDDLVNEAYLYLRRNDLPDGRRFDWIQIDEVQDLNPLQWEIVRRLTAASAAVVYFGDVEQAIFSFLGASTGHFATETADCERHYFRTNFRATPLLLEILMRFSLEELRSDWEFLPAPVDVHRPNGEVTLTPEPGPASVVARVDELLGSETAQNVAILVRNNASADAWERLVARLGYRTVKVSGQDLFSYAPMRDFLAFVSLFVEKPPMTAWVSLVRRFSKGIFNRAVARYFVRNLFAVGWPPLRIFGERESIPSTPFARTKGGRWAWAHRGALNALRKTIKPAYDRIQAKLESRLGFRALFAEFASFALSADHPRYSIQALLPERRLTREAAAEIPYGQALEHAVARIEAFLRYTDARERDECRPLRQVLAEDWDKLSKLKEADLLVGDEKVVISTIHKAKGRQFDAVVIPSVTEVLGGFGSSELDEPKRLLYVAMSRAKRHLSLFGCPSDVVEGSWSACFAPGYEGYYLRKAGGADLSGDSLARWERLAAFNSQGTCPTALVLSALKSHDGPLVRLALKTLRHCPDRPFARTQWLSALETQFAETAIGCLSGQGLFDAETMSAVRLAALTTREERVARAAFAYFRSVDSPADVACACAAIGDFLYHPSGELRLSAASALAAVGDLRWRGLITGAQRDFDRLATVPDADHESSIRTILGSEPGERYERALRNILFRRAG